MKINLLIKLKIKLKPGLENGRCVTTEYITIIVGVDIIVHPDVVGHQPYTWINIPVHAQGPVALSATSDIGIIQFHVTVANR